MAPDALRMLARQLRRDPNPDAIEDAACALEALAIGQERQARRASVVRRSHSASGRLLGLRLPPRPTGDVQSGAAAAPGHEQRCHHPPDGVVVPRLMHRRAAPDVPGTGVGAAGD